MCTLHIWPSNSGRTRPVVINGYRMKEDGLVWSSGGYLLGRIRRRAGFEDFWHGYGVAAEARLYHAHPLPFIHCYMSSQCTADPYTGRRWISHNSPTCKDIMLILKSKKSIISQRPNFNLIKYLISILRSVTFLYHSRTCIYRGFLL